MVSPATSRQLPSSGNSVALLYLQRKQSVQRDTARLIVTAGSFNYRGTYSFVSHNQRSDDEEQRDSERCHAYANKCDFPPAVLALFLRTSLCEGREKLKKTKTRTFFQVSYYTLFQILMFHCGLRQNSHAQLILQTALLILTLQPPVETLSFSFLLKPPAFGR